MSAGAVLLAAVIARASFESQEVEWRRDEAWFAAEVAKGPCPAAGVMYNKRGKAHNRTCWDRLDEIQHLRAYLPNGTGTFPSSGEWPVNVTIVGDSLAEQHFLALVCYAWSTGVTVEGPTILRPSDPLKPDWGATIGGALRLTYVRQDRFPTALPAAVYIEPSLVIVGGFNHFREPRFVNKYLRAVAKLRQHKRTLFVEALPRHFPGGYYLPGGMYPKSPNGRACVDVGRGRPDVNDLIAQVARDTSAAVLRVERLYLHRGQAHVGRAPPGKPKNEWGNGRDCLHWCVAPGVLDALALVTLRDIATLRAGGEMPKKGKKGGKPKAGDDGGGPTNDILQETRLAYDALLKVS
eukprot:Hpha_TRINITY_DN16085_c1_g2::TRINITY_DN16085_c1_g2_i2::g.118915::m.118915